MSEANPILVATGYVYAHKQHFSGWNPKTKCTFQAGLWSLTSWTFNRRKVIVTIPFYQTDVYDLNLMKLFFENRLCYSAIEIFQRIKSLNRNNVSVTKAWEGW